MKKIFISNITDTYNYGSAMMAINLIEGLSREYSTNMEIFCDCDNFHVDRLREATGVLELKSYMPKKIKGYSYYKMIKRYVFGFDQFIQNIRSRFDAMIVLGGDDLSETYMKNAIKQGLLYRQINKKCKVILASQSLGPFSGKFEKMAKIIFKNLYVITRDDNSYHYSKNKLKIKSVFKGRDLAFLPLPKQEEFSKILDKESLIKRKYIVLVPSGLVHRYTANSEKYIETWLAILKLVRKLFPDYTIVLLSHVLLPEKVNDAIIVTEIMKKIDGQEKNSILSFTDPMQPAEIRSILGNSYFVITGRMHAAISTFFMKKPAISLAYSEKYFGVIGEGLGLSELIIDTRNQKWHKDSNIIKELYNCIKLIQQKDKVLLNKINNKVKECKSLANDQLKYIYKIIN